MPQQTASDLRAPASATPAPAQAPASPISPEQAAFLRARRNALSNQLESAQGRRDEVAEALRDNETQASERPGLQERLRVLDERLIQLERDIAQNGQELANAPAEAGSEAVVGVPGRDAPPLGFFERANPNTITFFSFLLLMPIVVHLSRRFLGPKRGPSRQELAEAAAMKERMDRLDTALDAVAFEVERIGEGQRFLTQAMTDPVAARANGAPGAVPEPVPFRGMTEPR